MSLIRTTTVLAKVPSGMTTETADGRIVLSYISKTYQNVVIGLNMREVPSIVNGVTDILYKQGLTLYFELQEDEFIVPDTIYIVNNEEYIQTSGIEDWRAFSASPGDLNTAGVTIYVEKHVTGEKNG